MLTRYMPLVFYLSGAPCEGCARTPTCVPLVRINGDLIPRGLTWAVDTRVTSERQPSQAARLPPRLIEKSLGPFQLTVIDVI